MKKVLVLRANPVNPDSRVEKEANALLKAGYNIEVFAWDRDCDYKLKQEELLLEDGKTTIYRVGIKSRFGSGIKNLFPLLKYQIEIYKFLKKKKGEYDILHACDFDTAFTAFLMRNNKKTKFIYDIFDYYVEAMRVPRILKPVIVYFDKIIINKADAVIICTEKREEQIAGTTPRKLTVIHNSPPQREIHDREKRANDKLKIAYFGIFSANGRMIKELLEIISNDNRYELHIGGFGAINEVVEEYSNHSNNIKFYGRVPYEGVLKYESKCDVITAIYDPKIPNHKYAAPNKFYEGLMLGKPLIMVEGTGLSEVVKGQKIGCEIKYDIDSLKQALDNLYFIKNNQSSDWDEMSNKMKMLYKEKYSWSAMEQRLVNLYKNL